jgi:hypothetical protein
MQITPKNKELLVHSQHDPNVAQPHRRNNTGRQYHYCEPNLPPKGFLQYVVEGKKVNEASGKEATPNDKVLIIIHTPTVIPFTYEFPDHPQHTTAVSVKANITHQNDITATLLAAIQQGFVLRGRNHCTPLSDCKKTNKDIISHPVPGNKCPQNQLILHQEFFFRVAVRGRKPS